MAVRVEGTDNGRVAWVYQNDVGVECGMCSHRGLVPLAALKVGSGDMSRLLDRRFKCTPCGSRFVGVFFVHEGRRSHRMGGFHCPDSFLTVRGTIQYWVNVG